MVVFPYIQYVRRLESLSQNNGNAIIVAVQIKEPICFSETAVHGARRTWEAQIQIIE